MLCAACFRDCEGDLGAPFLPPSCRIYDEFRGKTCRRWVQFLLILSRPCLREIYCGFDVSRRRDGVAGAGPGESCRASKLWRMACLATGGSAGTRAIGMQGWVTGWLMWMGTNVSQKKTTEGKVSLPSDRTTSKQLPCTLFRSCAWTKVALLPASKLAGHDWSPRLPSERTVMRRDYAAAG